jgi:hypothetical protein
MILKMTDRVMVILTGLGIKIFNSKKDELEKTYGKTGMPQIALREGNTVMRSTLRMLFAIYGDHMTSKNRHKRAFVQDTLVFEDLESLTPEQITEQLPDRASFRINPRTGVAKVESVTQRRQGPRVIKPDTLTVKHISDTTEASKRLREMSSDRNVEFSIKPKPQPEGEPPDEEEDC